MEFDKLINKLNEAKDDPEAMVLATVDIVMSTHKPELFKALEAAAIPHWFDAHIIAQLLQANEPDAKQWMKQLQTLPFVESFKARNGWNLHEATRFALRSRLSHKHPERFQKLSARAVDIFDINKPAWQVEKTYHWLVAFPEAGANALEKLYKNWNDAGRHEQLQALGNALDELLNTRQLQTPAQARTLLCLSWIRKTNLSLTNAEKMAREALELFDELNHSSGQADSHAQLGDILVNQGKLADAMREYQIFKQIMLRLSQVDLENTDWQRELSASHSKIGLVLQKQDKLDKAMREIDAGRQIILGLIQSTPENIIWLRDLSHFHNQVGQVLQMQGKLDKAIREFDADKQIMEKLTQTDPNNTAWLCDLSDAHNSIGRIRQEQSRLAEAMREYEVDKRIMKRLAQIDPNNTVWLRNLSDAHNNIGCLLQKQGILTKAKQEFEEYKQIMLRLTQMDPDNTDWLHCLSVSHNNVGCLLQEQEKLAEAMQEFEEANAIQQRLVTLDITNTTWQRDLRNSQSWIDYLKRVNRIQESQM